MEELKMAISRIQIDSNKKTAHMKQQMRDIAKLLAEDPPKEEKARIRAEALVRYDDTLEAYEILQLTCELLSERTKLLASSKECPDDLKVSIATLMWASHVVEIPELTEIRKMFRSKYGGKFEDVATMNKDGNMLNNRVVEKLSVMPPTAFMVQTYLEKIAEQFEVSWQPSVRLHPEALSRPMAAPVGFSVMASPGTGLAPTARSEFVPSASNNVSYPTATVEIPPTAPGSATNERGKLAEPAIAIPVANQPSSRTFVSPYIPQYTHVPPLEPDIVVPPAASLEPDISVPPVSTLNTAQERNLMTSQRNENDEEDELTRLQARLARLAR